MKTVLYVTLPFIKIKRICISVRYSSCLVRISFIYILIELPQTFTQYAFMCAVFLKPSFSILVQKRIKSELSCITSVSKHQNEQLRDCTGHLYQCIERPSARNRKGRTWSLGLVVLYVPQTPVSALLSIHHYLFILSQLPKPDLGYRAEYNTCRIIGGLITCLYV